MSGKRKIRKVRSRLMAGIFCISLFLSDMTTVVPVWAQEMVQTDDMGKISDQTDREENVENPAKMKYEAANYIVSDSNVSSGDMDHSTGETDSNETDKGTDIDHSTDETGSAETDGSADIDASADETDSAETDGSADIDDSADETDSAETDGSADIDDSAGGTDSAETDGSADMDDSADDTDADETEKIIDSTEPLEDTEVSEDIESLEDPVLSETANTDAADENNENTVYSESEIFYTELPEADMTLSNGNVLIGVEGTYYTETAQAILDRINEIRLEACKEGVRNPMTGKPLTEADYVPMKWSSDLEAIARLRAAEATIVSSHTRPNGYSCFSARTLNGIQAEAECLAWTVGDEATVGWSHFGLMAGIEAWYSEKKYLVEGGDGDTGHYEELIYPSNRYVGIGAFSRTTSGQLKSCAVAGEFSSNDPMDSMKNQTAGKTIQYIEVPGSAVVTLMLEEPAPDKMEVGNMVKLSISGTIKPKNNSANTGPIKEGALWSSSDPDILTVDEKGYVTALQEGTAEISITVGKITGTHSIQVYAKGNSGYQLRIPTKTTYLIGESLDLKGAQIVDAPAGKTVGLTSDMISGFDTGTAGIKTICVVWNGYAFSFEILVIEIPELTAHAGQELSQITLPQNAYGLWQWDDPTQRVEEAGQYKCKISFTPNDLNAFQKLDGLDAVVEVYQDIDAGSGINVAFYEETFTYNGTAQKPKVEVSFHNKVLNEGEDYVLTYENNRNAGTAHILITGKGYYQGSATIPFVIERAKLQITAKDQHILCYDPIPQTFGYEIEGLAAGESLVREPVFTCSIKSTESIGIYDIIPDQAQADSNYDEKIIYRNGRLTVSEERVSYMVTFDTFGHGEPVESYVGIKAGDTIQPPTAPTQAGYVFEGWYKDALCKTVWNFDTDTVQQDITLYAKWLMEISESDLRIQEIPDVIYTGKAMKPVFNVYDGDVLLQVNKDYKISYFNNVAVNTVKKNGSGSGESFNDRLPYAVITGKGNYTNDTISINFNILPAAIDDGNGNPAQGVTFKYTEQMVTNKSKELRPFSSLKYRKVMKQNEDYELELTAQNVLDENGRKIETGRKWEQAYIPAGYSGSFELSVTGIGNYAGTIKKSVYVADKANLLKNVKITLGKNIKSMDYTGTAIRLTSAYYNRENGKYYLVHNGEVTLQEVDPAEVFTVTCGKESLIEQKDFIISYSGNKEIGKAVITVKGMGRYFGMKSVNFQIKGTVLKSNNTEVILDNMRYTGKAVTQNTADVYYIAPDGNKVLLAYGDDYSITYKNHIRKGTATMIFTAVKGSAYSGSFSKKFKIESADLSNLDQVVQADSMKNITAVYEKTGAKPVEQVLLMNRSGVVLKNGVDYTVSFKNNKSVADKGEQNAPLMIIKGKGNYKGILELPFSITKADLSRVQVTVAAIAYNQKKEPDFCYKPTVKVKDQKSVLSAKTDYTIEYINNTKADYDAYAEQLESGIPSEAGKPAVVIRARENGNYISSAPVVVPINIYKNKLTKKKIYVVVEESVYSGSQLMPHVDVYYSDNAALVAQAQTQKLTDKEQIKSLGLVGLNENTDYVLLYGTNINAGKSRGSVKISGTGLKYGGSVTVKFTIQSKGINGVIGNK